MYRVAILAIVLPLLFVGAASGQAWVDDTAIGVTQPRGARRVTRTWSSPLVCRMEKPVTEKVSVKLAYCHGDAERQ